MEIISFIKITIRNFFLKIFIILLTCLNSYADFLYLWERGIINGPTDKWTPNAFNIENEKVPVDKSFNDNLIFLKNFKIVSDKNYGNLKRDEFESDIDFKNRILKNKIDIYPFNLNDKYAFKVLCHEISYNFEKSEYTIGKKQEYFSSCISARPNIEGYVHKTEKKYLSFPIGTAFDYHDSYVGKNNFGIKKEILRFRDIKLHAAVSPDDKLLKKVFYKSYLVWKGSNDSYGYEFYCKFKCAQDVAKEIKKDIAIAFILKIKETKLFRELGTSTTPTLSDPTDHESVSYSIPFEIQNIIIYHNGTGKILANFSK